MKYACGFLLLLAMCGLSIEPAIDVRVSPEASMSQVDRIGVNLGLWTSWGAEQLSANVLKNPGFEGILDRAIVIVSSAGEHQFVDDVPWLARPEGFWDNGRYDVLSGGLRGRSGKVVHSATLNEKGSFAVSESLVGLAAGDVISLTAVHDASLPTQWWLEGTASVDPQIAPGSSGVRSLRLRGPSAAVSYLDTIGGRAGKLLPMNREWTCSVWAKGGQAATPFRVIVRRSGYPPVLDQPVLLDEEWKEYRWVFQGSDKSSPETLEVRFESASPDGIVWLDDASLRASTRDATEFRDEVVDTLRTLRPGYLRDWQGQLGDTWKNRIATQQARRASRYRPGDASATDYGYSLPAFLQLASMVGATPWVVLSPTFTAEEWQEAGRYLASEADRYHFREILVEFGNENWNEVFRPAGIPDVGGLGATSAHAFEMLAKGSGGDTRLRPVLGGAFANPQQTDMLAATTSAGTLLAVAPYWAYDLKGTQSLFPLRAAQDLSRLTARREVAIYEMNAHSLSNSLPAESVNQILDSPAAGTALAWHAMGALQSGVQRICVYAFAGFDVRGDSADRLVHLFGVTRDLAAAGNLRPTGEALARLNSVITGQLHRAESSSANVRAVAFSTPAGWRVAVASASARAETVRIQLPASSGKNNIVEINMKPYGFETAIVRKGSNER